MIKTILEFHGRGSSFEKEFYVSSSLGFRGGEGFSFVVERKMTSKRIETVRRPGSLGVHQHCDCYNDFCAIIQALLGPGITGSVREVRSRAKIMQPGGVNPARFRTTSPGVFFPMGNFVWFSKDLPPPLEFPGRLSFHADVLNFFPQGAWGGHGIPRANPLESTGRCSCTGVYMRLGGQKSYQHFKFC